VARVLEEEPVPLKIVRNYPPYHEARDVREARAAIVELRLSGWSVKAIAGYLGVHDSTVYRTLERWKEKGFEGLSDGTLGRPRGVRKADFVAVEAIRRHDLSAFLSVLYRAVERHGPPGTLVTDSGSVFLSKPCQGRLR
jgi:Homeodomain-like domain